MALKVGIAVVAMNRPEILNETLGMIGATTGRNVPVVVVDNGSTTDALMVLAKRKAQTGWHVIHNPSNLGLSRAVNQGLAHLARIGCEVLVHLDDDALIPMQGWPDLLAQRFEACGQLGLAVPNGTNYVEAIDQSAYREVRWALGYVWGMRRTVYDMIGGYDELLLHQQECDFGLRVRMAGYHVGGLGDWTAVHNDPGGVRSDLSRAREHIGVVQFRDKWCSYFRGAGWTYGTMPLYLMQHWPPDQEWFRRFALHYGVDLNPAPPGHEQEATAGAVIGLTEETAAKIERRLRINGAWYLAYVDLRNDYGYWAAGNGYHEDRAKAIDRWRALTGEHWLGYPWTNQLRPPRNVPA